jgi:DNA-binding IclR family transcriptional regulator
VDDHQERIVGADRVLAILVELAEHPDGIGLDDLAARVQSSKSTVHRALTSLRRAGLASQPSRGAYVLGDEFLRLAFTHDARRPERVRIEPALRELARRFGETTHYAVLDRRDVIYRAKVDPPEGAVRLTSVVGGRNPAYSTAVGKLLLSYEIKDEEHLGAWVGASVLEPRTDRTITTIPALWAALVETRARGFGTDDQENELGVNCLAVPVRLDPSMAPVGAVSVSALAFRTPLDRLIAEVDTIREAVAGTLAPR